MQGDRGHYVAAAAKQIAFEKELKAKAERKEKLKEMAVKQDKPKVKNYGGTKYGKKKGD